MDTDCSVPTVHGGWLGTSGCAPPCPPHCSKKKGSSDGKRPIAQCKVIGRPLTQLCWAGCRGARDLGRCLSPMSHSYGDPKQWAAFLGTPFLSGADGQLERVVRIHKHPFYNVYTLDYDVALLELAGPVRRSRLVRPICLPEPGPRPPDGARCVITGWGSVREGGRHGQPPRPLQVRGLGCREGPPPDPLGGRSALHRAGMRPHPAPSCPQAQWQGSCRKRPCASSASRHAAASTRCRSAAACYALASHRAAWTAAR